MAWLDETGLSHFLDKLKTYFLPLGGGTVTGAIHSALSLTVSAERSTGGVWAVKASRSDTGNAVQFGVGSNGNGRGIYDPVNQKWMFLAGADNCASTQMAVTDVSDDSSAHLATTGWTKDVLAASLGDLAGQDTVTHSQVSDWADATSSFLTEHQDISGLLAKTGGTMTGGIIFGGSASAGYVRRATTDAYTAIEGGSSTNNGAVLILSGGTRSGYEGLFRLSARTDSSHIKNLDGWADGTLTWGGENLATQAYVDAAIAAITDADSKSY